MNIIEKISDIITIYKIQLFANDTRSVLVKKNESRYIKEKN